MSLLTIQNLEYAYGERRVLQGLNLSVGQGEIVGLLGPNGSGKSTAFAVLAGVLPLQGQPQIEFDGNAVKPGAQALRRGVGVVFQSPSLDQRLTGRQNLDLAAMLQGISKKDRGPRIEEALKLAALKDRADEACDQLSGGMRRRLDIARALLHQPTLLLMDEPTSGLDEPSFRALWDELERMRTERNVSVLLTTHRPEEAERCDRICILDGGKIVITDTPDSLREKVSSDVLVLETAEPERLANELQSKLNLTTIRVGNELFLECERGHELIPRLVEAFPDGQLRSVGLRRPTLADVFLKITGHSLAVDV